MWRLLLVEDSNDDADLVRMVLDDAGIDYELRQAWSRKTLLEALDSFAPTVAVSDLNLPGYCGVEALQLLHRTLPDLPLVLLSGDPRRPPGDVPAMLLDKADLARLPGVLTTAIGLS